MCGKSHRVRVLVLAACSWCAAFGQQPAPVNPPEITTRDSPATFRTGVNLVLVPVVVRDRAGRAVGNLRREDFELQDKGKPQIISRFSVESSAGATSSTGSESKESGVGAPVASAAPAAPRHFVAYLFDDVHLATADLLRARAAFERRFSEGLDPAERTAIYTTSGRISLEFTDNRQQLLQTVERIQPYSSAADVSTDCPHVDYYMADLILNKSDRQAMNVATNDALLCMVPNTRDLPPAAIQAAQSRAKSAAQRVLRAGDSETLLATDALRDLVRRMAVAPGSRSIVLISSGFLLTPEHRADQADVIERAIRANVAINALDARALFGVVGGEASQRTLNGGQIEFRVQYESANAFVVTDTMAELAEGTGGQFFHNSNDLSQGLHLLAAPPEFVYVLGFVPQDLKDDGSFHPLKVSLRNSSGFTIQARRGYYASRHPKNPDDEAAEEILEAVFSNNTLKDIPLSLNMRYVKTGEFKATLSVIAAVDAQSLRFRKDQGRSHDDLTVVTGIFDGNGNFLSGGEKTVEMHLRDQTLAALAASGIRVRNTFELTTGTYRVRVVARDREGKTMAAADGAIQIP